VRKHTSIVPVLSSLCSQIHEIKFLQPAIFLAPFLHPKGRRLLAHMSSFIVCSGSCVVRGNSRSGNSRSRESLGIPREFPVRKWRFPGIPMEFQMQGGLAPLQRGLYLLGDCCLYRGVVVFTGGKPFIAPPVITSSLRTSEIQREWRRPGLNAANAYYKSSLV